MTTDVARDQFIRMWYGATTALLGRHYPERFLAFWLTPGPEPGPAPVEHRFARQHE